MLKFMRDHLGKTFLVIIVGAISVVFVLFGVFPDAQMGGVGSSHVAKVGGETVSLGEFQNAVNREVENYRAMGASLPEQLMANVRQSVLMGLVQQKLMLHEARRLGISASDMEVMAEIQKMPFFQDKEKKVFSADTYKKVLAQNNLSTGQFEQNVRDSLTFQKIQEFLEARIRITNDELVREFELANEQRDLSFVRFTRDDAMKRMNVSKEEVQKYLADPNKEQSLKTYYAQNDAKYNKPETVCARHILKRAEGEAKAGEAMPKEFTALKPSAGNFAKLAEKSDDPGTKQKGGDLGCFPKGMMDQAFEEAAFTLPLNQVSKPVRSRFGWHYILVYKKNPAITRAFEAVKAEMAEDLIKRDRIDEILKINRAAAEAAIKSWPSVPGMTVESTGLFNSLEGFIPKIGRAEEILKAAFDPKAKIQSGPQIFEAQGAVIVASIKSKKSADMKNFTANRDVQYRTLKERKLRAFMPAWMEDVRSRVKVSFNESLLKQM